jgi:hypothetical protein
LIQRDIRGRYLQKNFERFVTEDACMLKRVQGRLDMKKRDGTPVAALSLLTSLVRSSQGYIFLTATDASKSPQPPIQDLSSLASSENEEVAKRAKELEDAVAQWQALDGKGYAGSTTLH